MKLSVSVVIYQSKRSDLDLLLSSFKRSIQFAAGNQKISEVLFYIVDNCPQADQKILVDELFTNYGLNYKYIESKANRGYGHGHNQSIALLESDYHIICNPDIQLHDNTLSQAVDYFHRAPETVLLTPAVYGKDGDRHYLCKRNPKLFHLFLRRFCPDLVKNSLFKGYLLQFEYRDHDYSSVIKNIPFCTGCFMFFNSSSLKNLGGFDDRFFMYMEDADISRRALLIDETAYVPDVKVVHRWERGSYNNKFLRNTAIKSAFKYWWKWGGVF